MTIGRLFSGLFLLGAFQARGDVTLVSEGRALAVIVTL